MSSQAPTTGPDVTAWAGVRTILVPPDIVAVKRVSPVPVKKSTPWLPQADGEQTARAGGREWFSDRLFVESDPAQKARTRAACSTSVTAHASCMIGLVVVLLAQSDQVPLVRVGKRLVMPAIVSLIPVAGTAPAAPSPEPAAAKPAPPPAVVAPPPPAVEVAPAPIEAPSSIEPETGNYSSAPRGVEGGVAGGIAGGVVGGTLGGAPASGAAPPGPLRLGPGIEPPRKIKDVKPIYPQGGLADRARGTVVIEAVIGIDGAVHAAKVINSVALLDQAALDAVRQWEFMPSRLNGVAVAVIITIVVQFAIH